jgi:hypothetical protein
MSDVGSMRQSRAARVAQAAASLAVTSARLPSIPEQLPTGRFEDH